MNWHLFLIINMMSICVIVSCCWIRNKNKAHLQEYTQKKMSFQAMRDERAERIKRDKEFFVMQEENLKIQREILAQLDKKKEERWKSSYLIQ